jgi:hypothetical protein
MIVDFPVNVLVPMDASVATVHNTRPGQQATNGMRRSLGMSGAAFKMKFNFMVHDEATVRAARGFFWNMEGDSQLVRIRMPDRYGLDGPFANATEATRALYPKGIPFATDALYATGVGHAVPTLETTVVEAAALNSREIKVTLLNDTIGGCAISIDEFCYGIAGSWVEDGVNRLRLSPVLRKPISAGDVISMAPVFVGFCVSDTPGYDSMRAGHYGTHEIEFVEDLTRLVEDVD